MDITCILDVNIGHKKCYGSKECVLCGWNEREHHRRLHILHRNGLTKMENGLRCLVIEHKYL